MKYRQNANGVGGGGVMIMSKLRETLPQWKPPPWKKPKSRLGGVRGKQGLGILGGGVWEALKDVHVTFGGPGNRERHAQFFVVLKSYLGTKKCVFLFMSLGTHSNFVKF